MGITPRDGVTVPFAALAPSFLARLLDSQSLARRDFFAVGVMPSQMISYIRNVLYVPVRTYWPDGSAYSEWDMLPEEIAAYKDPILRKKQRKDMEKHAVRRQQKSEAQRDIKALRKAGHAIPEHLKMRAAWATIRTTDGISRYEF
ncbi:TPA: hypothetical protein O9O01_004552 [Escherichia coli]|uniref:hypothetical protein n=1 Tax=Escherichia coli TaxID=562 RepID=UPI000DA5DF6B|nr:hypothetical protein [Escherichia coli]EDJ2335041.1 hypothetical protein [Salmonella enterica subsp. enterica serovar Mbandaka]MDD8084377.1 hypothetical protein [Escherichia coli]MDD8174203.1 hypothetical protein [Escherichia coli]MEC3734355.1 hypothetical protein [Escherichia coli]MQJ16235.1 hypothetical protein [Escherichia coli]